MSPSRDMGRYVTCTTAGESYRAFVPNPLPPEPPLQFDSELTRLLDLATQQLGRLDGATGILPDPNLFLYQYVRKEAVVSSQIEGTQSSLADLLRYEVDHSPGVPLEDAAEVSRHVDALDYGLARLADLPLSLRFIREIHERLMSKAKGGHLTPGEFRRSQNWIGGTRPGNARFVPPPPDRLMECLGPFELFLHDQALPPLVRAGLAHVQFETIHPFLDGNGRTGRLLIALMLVAAGVLQRPLLYLSLHFKTHRQEYYDRLQRVRTHGDWEGWMRYFLEAVDLMARDAIDTLHRAREIFGADEARLATFGRLKPAAIKVHDHLKRRAITSILGAAKATDINRTTVTTVLERLIAAGIVRELTGQRRNRLFAYDAYLALLSEGTEPLAA